MIHELREYKLKPGTIDEYLGHVEEKVARLRGDNFGRLVAFFRAASGDVERVVHIWEYPTLDARQAARAGLAEHAGWMTEFIASVWPIIEYQHVSFLEVLEESAPASFSGRGQYLLRSCAAATGRGPQAARLLRDCPVAGSQMAGRYLSIAPDGNTALDLVRFDADAAASRCFGVSSELVAAFKKEHPRSIQIDLLQPVAISPLK